MNEPQGRIVGTEAEKLMRRFARNMHDRVTNAMKPLRVVGGQADEVAMAARAGEGARARQFLEDPLFQEFVARAEANMVAEMTSLPLGDDKGRRNLAVAIEAQRQWVKYLFSLAGEGRAAESELARLRSGKRGFF
jgi:hypothetical protein